MLEDIFYLNLLSIQTKVMSSRLRFFFQYTRLDSFFLRPPEATKDYLFAFVEAYLESSWLSQGWYGSYIESPLIRSHFNQLMRAAKLLQPSPLWSKEYFFLCFQHSDPINFAHMLMMCHQHRLFNFENMSILVEHQNLEGLLNISFILDELGLLNRTSFKQVLSYQDLDELFIIINMLRKQITSIFSPRCILNETSLHAILTHQDLPELEFGLSYLLERDLLYPECFTLLIQTTQAECMAFVIDYLYQADILKLENLEEIRPYLLQIKDLAYLLYIMLSQMLLTQTLFSALVRHGQLRQISDAIRLLITKGILLNEDYFLAIFEHRFPYELSKAMLDLKQTDLLSKKYLNMIQACQDPLGLAWALGQLKQKHILTETHELFVMLHEHPREFALGLSLLFEANLLTPGHRDILVRHPSLVPIVAVYYHLHQAEILSEGSFFKVLNYPHPQILATSIYYFSQVHLLDEQVFLRILSIENLSHMQDLFHYMYQAHFLNERSFYLITDPVYRLLTTPQAMRFIWSRLTPNLLRRHWWGILEQCRLHQDLARIQDYLHHLLQQPQIEQLNHHQSTHTASVHATVSQSAKRLLKRYAMTTNMTQGLLAIEKYLEQTPPSYQAKAAFRGFRRLVNPDFDFKDASGIHLKELLVLVWTAIHDESLRQGSLDDALALLMEGLYEIQRGYNLNEQGKDLQRGKDKPICGGGSFNKLIEKLQGIHSDIEIIYLNPSLIGLKLPLIVLEKTNDHLKPLLRPKSTLACYCLIQFMLQIEEEGLSLIWPKIAEQVRLAIFDEFSPLFQGQDDQALVAMVEQGQWLNYRPQDAFKDEVLSSRGYRAWSTQRLSQNSLFTYQYLQAALSEKEATIVPQLI